MGSEAHCLSNTTLDGDSRYPSTIMNLSPNRCPGPNITCVPGLIREIKELLENLLEHAVFEIVSRIVRKWESIWCLVNTTFRFNLFLRNEKPFCKKSVN